jgi:hypothetical protein
LKHGAFTSSRHLWRKINGFAKSTKFGFLPLCCALQTLRVVKKTSRRHRRRVPKRRSSGANVIIGVASFLLV